ncbi:acyl-CoA dehydrogenase family protein [Pelagibacterium limicola]|uniref:acyl-CoA dehydrogenase family protein n=1 Tax=Pelagibacterium limicola TaxID=2791022 RepID=UPI0018AFF12F|nr:acyl-CoA dehydrogenase family protein [Pelagibacterium limicola]
MSYKDQVARTLVILARTPGWQTLKSLSPDCDDETVQAILEAAADFAEGVLAPLDPVGDKIGAHYADGRVSLPEGFAEAFKQFAESGWLGMDVIGTYGGQALPLTVQAAAFPLFDRACTSLMMAATSTRAAAHLLSEAADPATASEWVPNLVSGQWAANICISEPDAGSDVGRLRTRAEARGDEWIVNGNKIWISFGDHDLAERIGHCVLARTNEKPGTRGISLFLVPNMIDGASNGVVIERIEEKLGLHASPTCAMRFEEAKAVLLGEEGRGLPELFAMIELMRLATGCQGLGLASAAADIAEAYAAERRQGGAPDQPPVTIDQHPDVRRQLDEIRASTEILRAAVLELATAMDIARITGDAALADYTGWMLPLIKNFGAEAGFDVPNRAIQILGGAGYTQEWPLERHLRDARVFSIYEGTTGMQALDFLTRRLWRDEGKGLSVFMDRARQEAGESPALLALLDEFEALGTHMRAMQADTDAALYRADAYMRAAWMAVSAALAYRIGDTDALPRLSARFAYHAACCA